MPHRIGLAPRPCKRKSRITLCGSVKTSSAGRPKPGDKIDCATMLEMFGPASGMTARRLMRQNPVWRRRINVDDSAKHPERLFLWPLE